MRLLKGFSNSVLQFFKCNLLACFMIQGGLFTSASRISAFIRHIQFLGGAQAAPLNSKRWARCSLILSFNTAPPKVAIEVLFCTQSYRVVTTLLRNGNRAHMVIATLYSGTPQFSLRKIRKLFSLKFTVGKNTQKNLTQKNENNSHNLLRLRRSAHQISCRNEN